MTMEGQRHRCVGRASNPVGGATRCWVGSTPTPLRHLAFMRLLRRPILRLRCSPYASTAALLDPASGRSRQRLNAKCLVGVVC